MLFILFFFFQAEDGIRDVAVTGVQTCALPIWCVWMKPRSALTPNKHWRMWRRSRLYRRRARPSRSGGARRRGRTRRDRKSVVEGKSVDLGGRRIIKKKKEEKKLSTW